MAELLKRENFYPGWHMNKKSWYTVILDESVSDEELLALIQDSYELAAKQFGAARHRLFGIGSVSDEDYR